MSTHNSRCITSCTHCRGCSEQMFQFSFSLRVFRAHTGVLCFGLYIASCLITHGPMPALHIPRYSCIVRVLCLCLSLTQCSFVFWHLSFGFVWFLFGFRAVRWLQETSCIIGVGCPARVLGCAGRHSFHAAWRARAPERFDYLLMGNGLGRERFGLASWIVRHCPWRPAGNGKVILYASNHTI